MKDGYHSYCKQCLKSYSIEWGKSNRKKLLGYQRDYHYNRYHSILKFNPRYKIDTGMRRSISNSLHGRKNGQSWEKLVGYTVDELMKWLENKFSDGMTWENYGKVWNIDHIIPRSWFKYASPEDPLFKECWKLENLQPLEAKKNYRKGNKHAG